MSRKPRTWTGWVWRFNAAGDGGAFYDGQQGERSRKALPDIYYSRATCESGHDLTDGEAIRVTVTEVRKKP